MSTESNWDNYEEYTSALSSNVRKLAFAGVGIIWVLSGGGLNSIDIDDLYRWPLYLMIVALALDFMQYVLGAGIWWVYSMWDEHEHKRRGEPPKHDETHNSEALNIPMHVCFVAKTVTICIAYGWLLTTAYQQLF